MNYNTPTKCFACFSYCCNFIFCLLSFLTTIEQSNAFIILHNNKSPITIKNKISSSLQNQKIKNFENDNDKKHPISFIFQQGKTVAQHISQTREKSFLKDSNESLSNSNTSNTSNSSNSSGSYSYSSSRTSSSSSRSTTIKAGVGEYDPSERLPGRREQVLVGDPQIKVKKEISVSSILKELAAIQQQGPQKYCVLGTRHCSFLHQQIIELLAYALVLSGNHVYTSGAGGTHAATIRGALRAERPDLLTVVLPQSLSKQPKESQELLKDVTDLMTMPQNDEMTLDVASRICNSYLISQTDQLISFAFHESRTVIEATKEAKEMEKLVTVLYLD